MKINTMFVNEMENLEKVVNEIKMEDCIINFSKYLNSRDVESEVEKNFIQFLNKDIENFAVGVYMKKYLNNTKEELLINIESLLLNSPSLEDWVNNDSLDSILYNYSDADVYDDIKKYMSKALKALKEQYKATSIELKMKRLNNDIVRYKSSIEIFNNNLKKAEDELKNLK